MFGGVFDPDGIKAKIAEKEAQTTAPGFWDDNDKATKLMNEIKMLKGRVEPWEQLKKDVADIETLLELGMEEDDQSVEKEVKELYDKAKAEYDHQSILNLLSDEWTRTTASLAFMQVQVEQRLATGHLCLAVCTRGGQSVTATRWKFFRRKRLRVALSL